MKSFLRCAACAFAVLLLGSGCSDPRPTLHLYSWEGFVDPGLIKLFEKEKGCRVLLTTYDSNQVMYDKLKAGDTGLDLVIASSYMTSILNKEGKIERVDKSLIPNMRHVDETFLRNLAIDKAMDYSVPYMISNSGLAYNKSKVPEATASWKILEREDIRGRFTLLADMRETLGAALKALGFSLNTREEGEIQQAKDLVLKWKGGQDLLDSVAYRRDLSSGKMILVHSYSSDLPRLMEENRDIDYLQPEEGIAIASDDIVILKDSRQKALAAALINFLHDPAHAATNTSFLLYLCPNRASYALLSPELRSNKILFVPDETLAKSEVIRDLGDDNQKYIGAWAEIKKGKEEVAQP